MTGFLIGAILATALMLVAALFWPCRRARRKWDILKLADSYRMTGDEKIANALRAYAIGDYENFKYLVPDKTERRYIKQLAESAQSA